jgi:hypothetical protein
LILVLYKDTNIVFIMVSWFEKKFTPLAG